MILTLILSFIIFAAMWPYFIILDVLNFKKPENMMEKHLPGRPARRTIGRKNGDVVKSIVAILFGYIVLCGVFYGLLSVSYFFNDYILIAIASAAGGMAVYMMTPFNKLVHAYVTAGQIGVIHLCCSLSSFTVWSAFLYRDTVATEKGILLITLVVGAMLVFSRKQVRG